MTSAVKNSQAFHMPSITRAKPKFTELPTGEHLNSVEMRTASFLSQGAVPVRQNTKSRQKAVILPRKSTVLTVKNRQECFASSLPASAPINASISNGDRRQRFSSRMTGLRISTVSHTRRPETHGYRS